MRNLPAVDRPFPIGQVTDSFWETQQTNAEAADFIFYDHEFRGNTRRARPPRAKKHLEQVALRLEHVPFPVVIEESPHNARPELDQARRQTIVEQLGRLGVLNVEERVVVANAFPEGYTAQEAEALLLQRRHRPAASAAAPAAASAATAACIGKRGAGVPPAQATTAGSKRSDSRQPASLPRQFASGW